MNSTIKNAFFLNLNLVISTLVTLYSVRVLLACLGEQDYGLFNLIFGVVAMLAFLSSSMTISTQRNLTYSLELGFKETNKIFSNSIFIHIVLSIVILAVGVILKNPILETFLTIPEYKLEVSNRLYFLTIGIVVFTIISVPYESLLSAHERFGIISTLNILNVILKLISALLLYIYEENQLLVYSFAILMVSCAIFIAKYLICRFYFLEATLNYELISKKTCISLMSFVGWNTFGAICGVTRIQGLAVLLNVFFGLATNASYAIAVQVNSKLKEFSLTITRVFNPKIVKAESRGERKEMLSTSLISSQISLILFGIFSIPLLLNIDTVFKFWLGDYPVSVLLFVKLFFLLSFVNLSTIGLQASIQAIGDIKAYQMTIGTLLLMTLPVAYYCLYRGLPSYSIIMVSIGFEVLSCILRLIFLKIKGGLDISQYAYAITKTCGVVYFSYIFTEKFITHIEINSFPMLILSTLASSFLIILLSYLLLVDSDLKKKVKTYIVGR